MEDVDLFAKTDETDVAQNNGNEEDEEEVVDEVTLLVTDSRSLFSGLYS